MVVLVVAVLLVPDAPAGAEAPGRVPDERVRLALQAGRWSPAAIEWFVATVPVEVDPTLPATAYAGSGHYEPAVQRGGPRAVVADDRVAVLEHEAHHAWDIDHEHQTSGDRRRDLEELRGEPGLATAVERALSVDDWHLTHVLLVQVHGRPDVLPAWYRARYYGYLMPHRVVLPAVTR